MLDARHSRSWWHIQAPWPCSWGRMELEQMAASRTWCLWLLLQLGVGEERFGSEVMQELAPNVGSPVVCTAQPSGGEEERILQELLVLAEQRCP